MTLICKTLAAAFLTISLLLTSCTAKLPETIKPPTAPFEDVKKPYMVCLDAGHQAKGNSDKEPLFPGSTEFKDKVSTGTRGVVTRVPEHEINLTIASLLEKALTEQGIKVVMIRDKSEIDISNKERAEMANQAQADLFLRLHCDSSTDQKLNGVGIFYPAVERELVPGTHLSSKSYSAVILESLEQSGFKVSAPVARADLTGFNWSKVPTVLVEMGFMSNPQEDKLLASREYQEKIARALTQGILKALKQ